jgi:hypothetical protein
MQPAQYDFPPLTRGDSEKLSLILKQRDLFTQQISLLPVAGATVTWTIKKSGGQDLVKSTGMNGGLTLTANASRLDWVLTALDWTALPGGSYPYRIRIAFSDGTVVTYMKGTLTVVDLS